MLYSYEDKKEVLNTEQSAGYLLAETAKNDIVELHIHQNGFVPAHALPIDVIFYVISGRGSITVSGDVQNVSRGDVVEVKKDLDRTWQNPHNEPLTLLVIKMKS